MADITAYDYSAASPADRLRYAEHQLALAMKAETIRSADGREITRQSLASLRAEINELKREVYVRGGVVHSAHARRTDIERSC